MSLVGLGMCLRSRLFALAGLIGVAELTIIAMFGPASWVVGKELRRAATEDRLSAHFGGQYGKLYAVLLEGLVRIDPFKTMYGGMARRQHLNHEEYYEDDVLAILSAICNIPPAALSPEAVRRAIFQALKENAFGNRWGEVGSEERYAGLALEVWDALRGGAGPTAERATL